MFTQFAILGWIRSGHGIRKTFANCRVHHFFEISRFIRKRVLNDVSNTILYISYIALAVAPFLGSIAVDPLMGPGPAHEGINSYSAQEGINSKGNIIGTQYLLVYPI